MGYTFSTDQQSIIDARHQNILVSAAAGSGKTSVLTERIVGLVNDPVNPIDIDRVLVVTFTQAAAAEMKERIGQRLNELIASHPEDPHLQKQATLIHGAQITTIDSFCLYVLRNHFHKIDVDPSFRIASEGEMKLIKEEVLKDVIKRAYATKDEDFYHMVDCYSKKDKDDSIENSIMSLFTYAMSYPWPLKWLEERREDYSFESETELENSKLISDIRKEAARELDEIIKQLKAGIPLCLTPQGPYQYEGAFNSDIETVSMAKEKVLSLPWDRIGEAFDVKFVTAPQSKDSDPLEKKYVQDYRNACKDAFSKIKPRFFASTLSENFNDMKASGRVVNKLIDLVVDFTNSLEKEKRDRGIIDFSDMEHMAVRILIEGVNPDGSYEITDVAKSYRDYFEEVMVDEYQDSNLVQELIIQSVSRELSGGTKNRFMVGDVKQSIYRFRLARPEIFMEKTTRYSKEKDASDRLITLKQNFRSRQSVIDSVNVVFEDAMTKETGGIEYDDDAKLYKGGSFNEDTDFNRSEVVLIEKPGKAADARKLEAEAIALKIQEIVGKAKLYDGKKKEERTASYGDIALLFRAPTKWLNDLKDAFEKYGIPYHLDGVGAFYDTREIKEVISFLKVLNNPLDDIALYAAMTSSFGKMTDEECARIKGLSESGNRFLFDKVQSYYKNHPEDKKVEDFLLLVDKYRKLSKVVPIHELISRLFDETGYKHIVAAMPGGKQRLANVEMLIMKAAEYAKTSFYGLFHFLRYVELIKKMDEDEGEANTFDEASDVVRVMSIHRSKGLEFPVCIIGGIDENFNDKDLNAEFVTDIDLGVGASFIDPKKRIKRSTIRKNYIKEKSRLESTGEEIRILYVAMTRAKEKLIMMGMADEPATWIERGISKGAKKSYLSLIQSSVSKNVGTLFDFTALSAEDIASKTVERDVDSFFSREMLEEGAKTPDTELVSKLIKSFSFEYPHKGLSKLYTKTTVSELKMAAIELKQEESESAHPFGENESREYIPVFAGGKLEVKGTDRGTAYHNVLQLLEYENLPEDVAKISDWYDLEINRILLKEEMTKEDVSKVFKGKMVAFLQSDTCKDMAKAARAGSLYKEQPFVIGVKASSIDEEFPEDETLLVQGVIDVYYILDGKVTVLDYKTDRVESGEELVNRYRKQLDYYGEAVSQLTGLLVKEKLIYSFNLQQTLPII